MEAEYDPAQTSLRELTAALKQESSFYAVIVNSEEEYAEAIEEIPPSKIKKISSSPHFIESKYSLKATYPDLYYLDLNEEQAIALNSWSYFGGKMPEVLSDEQKELRQQIQAKLRTAKPHHLHPQRSGKGLVDYRNKLLKWLEGL